MNDKKYKKFSQSFHRILIFVLVTQNSWHTEILRSHWQATIEFILLVVYVTHGIFFYSLSKRKKNTPKRGQLFSFFEIFTADFSHFLVTKKMFFVTKKRLNSAVEISKNEKSCPLFGAFFFRLGRDYSIVQNKRHLN